LIAVPVLVLVARRSRVDIFRVYRKREPCRST
jgi:hypothetical protein